jgi:hypothetical protein
MQGGMGPNQTVTLTYNGGGIKRGRNQARMCQKSGISICRAADVPGVDGTQNVYPNPVAPEGLLDTKITK